VLEADRVSRRVSLLGGDEDADDDEDDEDDEDDILLANATRPLNESA
jgi:hypothetical protein